MWYNYCFGRSVFDSFTVASKYMHVFNWTRLHSGIVVVNFKMWKQKVTHLEPDVDNPYPLKIIHWSMFADPYCVKHNELSLVRELNDYVLEEF